jgi:hypothetical protein
MTGRFTEATMTAHMRDIAAHLGMDSSDAVLLRLTNNAVFALPNAGLVIRITRSLRLRQRVGKVVDLVTWFAAIDAPTIRLTPAVPTQPVPIGDLLATVWTYLPPRQPVPTVSDLGHVLREFHHLDSPPMQLPPWDPIDDARERIVDAEALPDADRDFLLDWCERLHPRIADLNQRAAGGLVHGDAHAGNLLRTPDGRVVLCDFDATCRGPWQVDLVATAVGEARFGRAGAHDQLAHTYGYDVTTDPDWPTLRQARELKMVVAAVPLLASTPGIAHEFTVRMESIQHDDQTRRWTPFADLHRGT